jgi:hypothetical protein
MNEWEFRIAVVCFMIILASLIRIAEALASW